MNPGFRKVAFLSPQGLKVAFLNPEYLKVAFLNLPDAAAVTPSRSG